MLVLPFPLSRSLTFTSDCTPFVQNDICQEQINQEKSHWEEHIPLTDSVLFTKNAINRQTHKQNIK